MSLLAAPLEVLQPAALKLGWWQFRLLALINPLILLTVAVAVGCWASGKVGLGAPLTIALLDRRPADAVLRRQAGPALAAGIATALVLWGYGLLTAPMFAAAPKPPELVMPLVTKLLYGGIVEELMMRWGLMSLLVWLAWKASRAALVGTGAYLVGIAGAALLFAAGHLPALYALVPQPPAGLVASVIVGNLVPGVLFGWLFWKRGLEAAMLAHALGHLIFTLASASAEG